ncbi:MAG: SPFH domain-containing protein [Pirellulales bacterium]
MLGFHYLKAAPTSFVLLYKAGKVQREGAGLSFFYYGPTSTIASVPLATVDVPFVFNEATADFQEATVQGELTYRITDPRRVAALLDYSIDSRGQYLSDDPTKLGDRLIHVAQILTRAYTQQRKLRELLTSSDLLVADVLTGLKASEVTGMLGAEIVALSILSVKPTPDMAKALQAAAREQLLREADEAIYARRNAAVELERTIKENELNTEIAVEQKRRMVRETQMSAEIAVEERRAELVDRRVANERKEADAKAHALQAILEPLKGVDWKTLMAAAGGGADAKAIIALAFQSLAENAGKIGELNVSPDLLNSLLNRE